MKLIDTIEIFENLIHGDNSLKIATISATQAGEFTISANITQIRATLMQEIHKIVINEEGILDLISLETREIYQENFKNKSGINVKKIIDSRKNKAS